MGCRNKKADTNEIKDLRIAAPPPLRQPAGLSAESLRFENAHKELALPPLRTIKPFYRHLGYFQGRKVWESSLSSSYFH
ncbi:MAG: hypothetical protein ACYDIC_12945 [Desulfobaccales bacterium]